MYKILRRLFVRPSFREVLEDELYDCKRAALGAARLAAHYASESQALFARIQTVEEMLQQEVVTGK